MAWCFINEGVVSDVRSARVKDFWDENQTFDSFSVDIDDSGGVYCEKSRENRKRALKIEIKRGKMGKQQSCESRPINIECYNCFQLRRIILRKVMIKAPGPVIGDTQMSPAVCASVSRSKTHPLCVRLCFQCSRPLVFSAEPYRRARNLPNLYRNDGAGASTRT